MKNMVAVMVSLAMASMAVAGGIRIQEENDAFGFPQSDGYYTQGLQVQYVDDAKVYKDGSSSRHLYGLKNQIYTPRDIDIAAPQPEDRPWAGLTAGTYGTWERKGNVFIMSEWMLGVVGEWSQSDHIQTEFHKLIHNGLPMGWSNQIPNEVVGNYSEDRYYRVWNVGRTKGWSSDFAEIFGYALGTAFDYGKVGGLLRGGWNMPDEYHTGLIMPTAVRGVEENFSLYAFAGAEGKAVLHNITLGGSLFQDGPCQDLKNFVLDTKVGVATTVRKLFGSKVDMDISYQIVWRSMEYVGQKEMESFGSITLAFMRGF